MSSLATIYNTLHQFTQAGLLREVAVDPGRTAYFDTNTSDHHHFFIEGEGALIDLVGDIGINRLPPPPAGTKITSVELIVRVRREFRLVRAVPGRRRQHQTSDGGRDESADERKPRGWGYDKIAERRQQPAVRLVERREATAERLIVNHLPAPLPRIEDKRALQVGGRAERRRERSRVEESDVGALAELRAGGMKGVADRHHPLAERSRPHMVAIAGKGHLARVFDAIEERFGRGPQSRDPPFPRRKPCVKPGVVVINAEAPEEGCLRDSVCSPLTDRQNADHRACACVTLLERVPVKTRRRPRQTAPDRAVTEVTPPASSEVTPER